MHNDTLAWWWNVDVYYLRYLSTHTVGATCLVYIFHVLLYFGGCIGRILKETHFLCILCKRKRICAFSERLRLSSKETQIWISIYLFSFCFPAAEGTLTACVYEWYGERRVLAGRLSSICGRNWIPLVTWSMAKTLSVSINLSSVCSEVFKVSSEMIHVGQLCVCMHYVSIHLSMPRLLSIHWNGL